MFKKIMMPSESRKEPWIIMQPLDLELHQTPQNAISNTFQTLKRVVMIAPDLEIDRRIILEGFSLIQQGLEVILIAAWAEGYPETEILQGIKLVRVNYNPIHNKKKQITLLDYAIHTFTQMNQAMKEVSGETFVRSNSFFKLNLGIARFLIRQMTSCFKLLEKLNQFLKRCFQWMNQAFTGDALAYLPRTKNPGFQSFFGDLIAYYNPDVIHVHDLPMLPAGLYAKQKLRRFGRWVPVVYDAHEFYPEQPRLNPKHQLYLRKLEANYIGKADVAFTVNPLLAKEMERHYPGVSIGVVQNAINPPSGFDPSFKYNRFREEHHLPEDAILVLYQGWIAPGRNLEIIIEGMGLVPESSPFHLLLMGYGDYTETLQALVTRLELSHRVHFIPSQPQDTLLYYSASADVGLIPYPYHQDINTHLVSPNKLYEFIISGLPILSNELPFVKQLIETHGFGMCFDIQTPQGFANALEHYPLTQIQEFKVQLQNGFKAFLWETEAEQLFSYYHQLDKLNMRTLSS